MSDARVFCITHQALRPAGEPCLRCVTEDRLAFDARLSDLVNDLEALRVRVASLEAWRREAEKLINDLITRVLP